MPKHSFESQLSGGHPNSLGNTLAVVDAVLADQARFEELFMCYASTDEVVRLRTSNAVKRVCMEEPLWLIAYIDRLIDCVATIDQASTQWTLAKLFQLLRAHMSPEQYQRALKLLKHNLSKHEDWIVLNNTMETLVEWAGSDRSIEKWLLPQLQRLSGDRRKSVAKRASKLLTIFQ